MTEWDLFVGEIEPDYQEEQKVIEQIDKGHHKGNELLLLDRALNERWATVVHKLLQSVNIPSSFIGHHIVLYPHWVQLTCPYLAEQITKDLLNHNLSFIGIDYRVAFNDTFRRLEALHRSGVCLKDPNHICRKSMFFIFLLSSSGHFPSNGIIRFRSIFPIRSLEDWCKNTIRVSMGPCNRQALDIKLDSLEIPIMLKEYLRE